MSFANVMGSCALDAAGQGDDAPVGYGQSTKNRRNDGSPHQMPSFRIQPLKTETRARLNDPCSAGAQQLPEKGVVKARSQAGQVRMIQGVEQVGSNLHPQPFMDRNVF